MYTTVYFLYDIPALNLTVLDGQLVSIYPLKRPKKHGLSWEKNNVKQSYCLLVLLNQY